MGFVVEKDLNFCKKIKSNFLIKALRRMPLMLQSNLSNESSMLQLFHPSHAINQMFTQIVFYQHISVLEASQLQILGLVVVTLVRDFTATMNWSVSYHSELHVERQTTLEFTQIFVFIETGSRRNLFVPTIHNQVGCHYQIKLLSNLECCAIKFLHKTCHTYVELNYVTRQNRESRNANASNERSFTTCFAKFLFLST